MRKLILIICTILMTSLSSIAEEEPTLSSEGVNGFIDARHRSPVVSVRTTSDLRGTTILADAYVPNDELKDYPIEFKFFVNRSLFATQIRSKELPGPIGVLVPSETIPTPFNFAVLATVLYPNRAFSTFLASSSNESIDNTSSPVECITEMKAEAKTFSATNLAINKKTDGNINFSYPSSSENPGTVEVTLSSTNESTTGTVYITQDGAKVEYDVTGYSEFKGSSLVALNLSSMDNNITVVCR